MRRTESYRVGLGGSVGNQEDLAVPERVRRKARAKSRDTIAITTQQLRKRPVDSFGCVEVEMGFVNTNVRTAVALVGRIDIIEAILRIYPVVR